MSNTSDAWKKRKSGRDASFWGRGGQWLSGNATPPAVGERRKPHGPRRSAKAAYPARSINGATPGGAAHNSETES